MRECFCFGSEAVNAIGEAVRGLVKSRNSLAASPLANSSRASPERNIAALPPLARSRIPPATQATRVLTLFRYMEVDFTFGLPEYVPRYIEEFVISRFVISRLYSIHFTVILAGT